MTGATVVHQSDKGGAFECMESKTGMAGPRTSFKRENFVKLPEEQTMTTQPSIVSPQDYPRALSVLGVQITVLAPNTATQSYEITLQEGAHRRDRRRGGDGCKDHPHSSLRGGRRGEPQPEGSFRYVRSRD